MSRSRLHNKLRTNEEYAAITKFLGAVGLRFVLHSPTGSGHPFLDIDLPHGGEPLRHHINSTPRGNGNPRAALSKLKKALREAGYDLGS